MSVIQSDFNRNDGAVKPMHAVNNGPVGSKVRKGNSTYEYFREAGIPYARTHDASFSQAYGGEYTVDVHRIFRNFDADPTDPASYDFECTDQYVADTFSVGTEVYYRLGSRIEHGKKVGTFPPQGLPQVGGDLRAYHSPLQRGLGERIPIRHYLLGDLERARLPQPRRLQPLLARL